MKNIFLLPSFYFCCVHLQAQTSDMPPQMKMIDPPTQTIPKGAYQVVMNGDTGVYFPKGTSPSQDKAVYMMDSAYTASVSKERKTYIRKVFRDKNTQYHLIDLDDKLKCEANLCYEIDASKKYLEIEAITFTLPYTCEVTDMKTHQLLFSQRFDKPQQKIKVPLTVFKGCAALSVRSLFRSVITPYCP
jgi:hypothetical protein